MTPGVRWLLGLLLAVAGPTAVAAPQGRALASVCAACHADNGDASGIPPLAGMDEARMIDLMNAYRSGRRASQIMRVVAAALTPEEIKAIAHYIVGERTAGVTR